MQRPRLRFQWIGNTCADACSTRKYEDPLDAQGRQESCAVSRELDIAPMSRFRNKMASQQGWLALAVAVSVSMPPPRLDASRGGNLLPEGGQPARAPPRAPEWRRVVGRSGAMSRLLSICLPRIVVEFGLWQSAKSYMTPDHCTKLCSIVRLLPRNESAAVLHVSWHISTLSLRQR